MIFECISISRMIALGPPYFSKKSVLLFDKNHDKKNALLRVFSTYFILHLLPNPQSKPKLLKFEFKVC